MGGTRWSRDAPEGKKSLTRVHSTSKIRTSAEKDPANIPNHARSESQKEEEGKPRLQKTTHLVHRGKTAILPRWD